MASQRFKKNIICQISDENGRIVTKHKHNEKSSLFYQEFKKMMGTSVGIVSASSPLVGFGELNDNTIKGLTSLLSVSKVQQESKLDGFSHNVQMKTKVVYCYKLKLD